MNEELHSVHTQSMELPGGRASGTATRCKHRLRGHALAPPLAAAGNLRGVNARIQLSTVQYSVRELHKQTSKHIQEKRS